MKQFQAFNKSPRYCLSFKEATDYIDKQREGDCVPCRYEIERVSDGGDIVEVTGDARSEKLVVWRHYPIGSPKSSLSELDEEVDNWSRLFEKGKRCLSTKHVYYQEIVVDKPSFTFTVVKTLPVWVDFYVGVNAGSAEAAKEAVSSGYGDYLGFSLGDDIDGVKESYAVVPRECKPDFRKKEKGYDCPS